MGGPTITEALERLAPGTPMRQALERIIQQGKGGLVVLGTNGAWVNSQGRQPLESGSNHILQAPKGATVLQLLQVDS